MTNALSGAFRGNMKRYGIKAAEVAAVFDVSVWTLYRWVREQTITAENLTIMARYLHFTDEQMVSILKGE